MEMDTPEQQLATIRDMLDRVGVHQTDSAGNPLSVAGRVLCLVLTLAEMVEQDLLEQPARCAD
jgi:inactivated superfamily I helicase